MERNWSGIFALVAVVFVLYRFRYRLLNLALGTVFLRKLVVQFAMNIPGLRSKMMETTFRT
ncbi:hypothetical protein J2S13_000265 [Oikeobacillus pervagus]|uniref:Sodium:proton antiporter n=1 Tax=Oikeobacillus pervagus TaxID=1325931 RepID=A0AAJ1WJ83_9BACI|nr:hypothetical protein [Oikeobacillus pervagus]MDQ0213871.1 hypothetical protein [Oikeobacillus pervagus]